MEAKRMFNVPGGKAVKSLRQAARQANVEFILSAATVKDVKTQPVKGSYTPQEAFNLMLSGTSLVAFRHKASGVYAIKKENDEKQAGTQ